MEVNKEELRRLAGHASTDGWDRKRVFGQLNIQDENHMLGDNDAAYIAAANPAAILSLLDEKDKFQAENERLRRDLTSFRNNSAITSQQIEWIDEILAIDGNA